MRQTLRLMMQLLLAGLCAASAAHAQDAVPNARGTLYTMGNEPDVNTVFVFDRGADGRLSLADRVPTGGIGANANLGSQGALALNDDETRLFAVNAGGDDVSVFHVRGDSLRLIDRISARGDKPISLAMDDHILYVLNSDSSSISGYRATVGGLEPIPDAIRPLSDSYTDPAQISFSPDGNTLVITEKATNRITLYGVDRLGNPDATPTIVPSAGIEPFGFGFNGRRQLIVSEAFNGLENASAVSSYRLGRDGTLEVVSPSVPTQQTAACWIAITPNGRFAYSTNTGSGTISGFRVGPAGMLTRFDDGGVTADLGADSAPVDMAISPDGNFLYALASGSQAIAVMRIHVDGSLSVLEMTGGLTVGPSGLIVR